MLMIIFFSTAEILSCGGDFLISLWEENSDLPSFDTLEGEADTDVLIVGGGISGILCAYKLRELGIDYILVEADKICRKTTAKTTAKITSQHGLIYSRLIREFNRDYAKAYYEANEQALKDYRKLFQNIDCDYKETETCVYSRHDKGKITEELDALKSLGIESNFVVNTELPFEIAGGVKFFGQATFNPLKFIATIAKGLNIYENTRVLKITKNAAYTEKGRVRAKKIIITTHFPFIDKHGFYFLKMFQERSYVILLEGAKEIRGAYAPEDSSGLSFRGYGDLLLLGGSNHRTGKSGCGWEYLYEAAKKYYPDASVKKEWATQDCISLDGVPYIGKYSLLSEDLYVATGFNKWGMSSSMVAATLLCDLITGKKNKYEKIFTPKRSILRKQLAANTLEAVSAWLSFGKKRCPHLGCGLTYNKYEHTWDCPCHGSRFDGDGNLIDNPANTGIK